MVANKHQTDVWKPHRITGRNELSEDAFQKLCTCLEAPAAPGRGWSWMFRSRSAPGRSLCRSWTRLLWWPPPREYERGRSETLACAAGTEDPDRDPLLLRQEKINARVIYGVPLGALIICDRGFNGKQWLCFFFFFTSSGDNSWLVRGLMLEVPPMC